MHSATDQRIAANVADLANTKQVTLRALADSSGIAFDRLRGYLAADRGTLTIAEVARLADVLGVDPADLTTAGAA